MNPSLLGVLAAFALATGLWLARRRPRPLLTSTDTREVAALNRAQNTLVWEARQAAPAEEPPQAGAWNGGAGGAGADSDGWAPRRPLVALPAPRLSAAERQAWLRELARHDAAGGRQRLAAMRRARAWRGREVLPLLRRGLRDVDPAVMREAALAMEAFRGRSRPIAAAPAQVASAPRKVARTR
jgi:hypothetical protein